mmetsp:Transcript_13751/g.39272  ORF Transcript_13751/g.39272 Transcript_13751/m.39272 type:complete len:249 (-) Transcript_13751:630-1376(-)
MQREQVTALAANVHGAIRPNSGVGHRLGVASVRSSVITSSSTVPWFEISPELRTSSKWKPFSNEPCDPPLQGKSFFAGRSFQLDCVVCLLAAADNNSQLAPSSLADITHGGQTIDRILQSVYPTLFASSPVVRANVATDGKFVDLEARLIPCDVHGVVRRSNDGTATKIRKSTSRRPGLPNHGSCLQIEAVDPPHTVSKYDGALFDGEDGLEQPGLLHLLFKIELPRNRSVGFMYRYDAVIFMLWVDR